MSYVLYTTIWIKRLNELLSVSRRNDVYTISNELEMNYGEHVGICQFYVIGECGVFYVYL